MFERVYYSLLAAVVVGLIAHPDTREGVRVFFAALLRTTGMSLVALSITILAVGVAILLSAAISNLLRSR